MQHELGHIVISYSQLDSLIRTQNKEQKNNIFSIEIATVKCVFFKQK